MKDLQDPAISPPTDADPPRLHRRTLLGYAVSAPVATVAASFAGLLTPGQARAALVLTPPDSVDNYDVADSIVQTSLPTMPLVKLTVNTDSTITLALPRLESGQGVSTAVAMMVAEEFDAPLSQVKVTLADASPELVYNQITGGSSSVRSFDVGLPPLAAAARARLVLAAAQQWGVSPGTVTIVDGVLRSADGRTATLGSVTALAATLPLGAASPKSPTQYKLIGRPTGRIDALDIVTGRKQFALDVPVPNAMPTMLRMPSQIRGTLRSVNNLSTVKGMPGVIDVVVIPPGGAIVPRPPAVAVMAETFGQAYAACLALDITWGDGPLKGESDASIATKLKASLPPMVAPPLGALTVEGEFEWRAATHCPLEVETAVADVRPDRCEIWAGMQTPIVARQTVAQDLGLSVDRVIAHVLPTGGSFGRRLFWDPVQVAVQVSRLTGRPCKLMYHRTDDMRQTRLRPPQVHRVRATLLAGNVVAYDQQVAAVRLDARHGYGEYGTASAGALPPTVQQTVGNLGYEQFFFKTMVSSPYNFGVSTKVLYPLALEMNTVSFRSVHIQPARTVEELIVDEVAARMGKDPYAFRLEFLRLDRAKAVLRQVAAAGNWGRTMPAGFAQGIAVHQESRAFIACLVEVDGRIPSNAKVTKAVIAIDVGKPINPLGIRAQVEGGLADAITVVLQAGLTIVDGLPLEGSYAQYRVTQMKDFPKDVQIIVAPNTGDPVAGMGEVGFSPAAAAIACAYARATGIKPRKFPLNAPPVFSAIPPGQLPVPTIA